MKIKLVAVGKIKPRGLRDVLDDYLKRLRRYGQLEEIEIKDQAEVWPKMSQAIGERSFVVAMEVDGKALSSQGLADFVQKRQLAATKELVFLIGGSYGLPTEAKRRADMHCSLSPMILPHRLARVFLAEQLYRAFTILRGEPYSH